jgi:hypothetical protein
MYWGKRGQLATLKQTQPEWSPMLLVYNEPDFARQSNRTVDEVLHEWPDLLQFTERISAPTAGRPFDPWMREFMTRAKDAGTRLDVLPVHWYGAPNSKKFLAFLDKLHALYGLPIWITEFAVADWHSSKYGSTNRFTQADVVRFIEEVLPELENREYVHRYAWLVADTAKESLRPSLLFDSTGHLTTVGQAYAAFGASDGCGDVREP